MYDLNDEIENIKDSLKRINKHIDIISNENDKNKEPLELKKIEEREINYCLNVTSNMLTHLISLSQSNDYLLDNKNNLMDIEVKALSDGYQFDLPFLLARRNYSSEQNKIQKCVRTVYNRFFEMYDCSVGFKKIKGKVDIIYRNIYEDKKFLRDNDNLDTKPFTDCIAKYVMEKDDNPLFCNLYICGELGKENKTIVYVRKSK